MVVFDNRAHGVQRLEGPRLITTASHCFFVLVGISVHHPTMESDLLNLLVPLLGLCILRLFFRNRVALLHTADL